MPVCAPTCLSGATMSLLWFDEQLLVFLCTFLDGASIAALRLTSRALHHWLSGDALWRLVFLLRWPCPETANIARLAPRSWLDELKARERLSGLLVGDAAAITEAEWDQLSAVCETHAHRVILRSHLTRGVSSWRESASPIEAQRFVVSCMQGCGVEGRETVRLLLESLPWCGELSFKVVVVPCVDQLLF